MDTRERCQWWSLGREEDGEYERDCMIRKGESGWPQEDGVCKGGTRCGGDGMMRGCEWYRGDQRRNWNRGGGMMVLREVGTRAGFMGVWTIQLHGALCSEVPYPWFNALLKFLIIFLTRGSAFSSFLEPHKLRSWSCLGLTMWKIIWGRTLMGWWRICIRAIMDEDRDWQVMTGAWGCPGCKWGC